MQVCRAAGLATATIVEKKGRKITKWVPKARIHDLRHTFASTLVNQGKSLKIVGALIGHTQSKTTERYVHVAPSPLQEATNSFGKVFDRAKGLQVVPSQKDARKRAAGE
jgi:integrase